ncbi:MAG TPA: YIP1 family protein [Thermodesulfobacteriota bacterium]|nr:YIP1 family protein [Thermodesulfobacteriota bacterium]
MEGSKIDFAGIPQTAKKVLTSPPEFFREMPRTGGFVEPLVFMIAMGVVAGLIQSILSVLRLQVGAGMAMGMGSVIIMPIMIGIFGFVGAAVLFLIWKLMGSRESYETAYRCGAYIGALAPISVLLHLIPFAGPAASVILTTFFLVTASVAVHNIPSRKAWMVFGIIGGLLVFFSVGAEFEARRFARQAAGYQKQAEELRKQAEQFRKQAEEASRATGKTPEEEARQMQQQMEAQKTLEQMQQKAMEQMQKGAPKER